MTPDGQPFLQMRNFPKAWMANSESIEAKLRLLGCHVALYRMLEALPSTPRIN